MQAILQLRAQGRSLLTFLREKIEYVLHPDHKRWKIRGHGHKAIPPDEHLVPYSSIGDLLDRQAAASANKIWLIHYDADGNREEFTYGEFNRLVNQAANYLCHDLGIRRGDRVATIGYNHADLVILYFACWKLGATVAPQNIAEDDERIGYILRNSESVVVFARTDLFERAHSIVSGQQVDNVREIVEICADPCQTEHNFYAMISRQTEQFTPRNLSGWRTKPCSSTRAAPPAPERRRADAIQPACGRDGHQQVARHHC